MRVKINGREVEVGPSRHIQEKVIKSENPSNHIYQDQKSSDCPQLSINGREVNMNDPDEVNDAILPCRIIGLIAIAAGLLVAFFIYNEEQSGLDDIKFFLFIPSIFILIGSIFAFFVPRSLKKRLQELKKQGKIPSKYGKKMKVESSRRTQEKLDVSQIPELSDYPKLIVNGREVDLGDPRVIQKIGFISKKIGSVVMLIGLVFTTLDVLLGVSVILMGLLCKVYIPKKIEKILQELKKQGQIPAKK